MALFGISDLHLSFGSNKPMDVFGEHWHLHHEKMADAWDALVSDDDIVLCPGDLSWSMGLEGAKADLEWIHARKGKAKILTKGNHDLWWSSLSKVRAALPKSLHALQNDAIDLGEYIVAGSRLWACPGGYDFEASDEKIYQREIGRLKLSLEAAKRLQTGTKKPLYAAIHYPPFAADKAKSATDFSNLLEEYGVELCVYGHLHGEKAHASAFQGLRNGIEYRLIACDALQFVPLLLRP